MRTGHIHALIEDWRAWKSSKLCLLHRYSQDGKTRTHWSSRNWRIRKKIGKWRV